MHYSRAFTLIELMVTLAVLAIVISLAAPSFSNMLQENRLSALTNELQGALQLARSEAVKRRVNVAVCRSNADQSDCENGTDWAGGWLMMANDEVLKVWDPAQGVTVTGPSTGVTFRGNGMTTLIPEEDEAGQSLTPTAPANKRVPLQSGPPVAPPLPKAPANDPQRPSAPTRRHPNRGSYRRSRSVHRATRLSRNAGYQRKSNHSAYQRSQATLFAYDLADRMRANRDAALGNDYLMDYPASSSSHSVTGSQAAKDKAEWLNNLALQLPEGTGKVEKTGTLVTIHVRWNDNRGRIAKSDAEADANTVFTYRTEI